jgi:hypothetical protein
MVDPTQPIILDPQVKHVVARDEHGRLLPGNTANPNGRPKRKTLTELLHEKLDSTPEGWNEVAAIILKLIEEKDRDIIKEFWQLGLLLIEAMQRWCR